MRSLMICVAAAVLGAAPTLRTGGAAEIKLVLIEVENAAPYDIFVSIDNTGRLGKDITADPVSKPDGTKPPNGLVIASKAKKSFGEAIGLGDSPTMHAWKTTGGKLESNDAFSSAKFSAADYATLPPKLELVFDGAFKKK
jgi:hypothetical protein